MLLKDVENIDLRMADERPADTNWSRDDNLIVSMTELRDSSKSSTRNGVFSDGNLKSLTGDEIEKVNLQIVLGDGNDSVILKQITGQTSIYGGQVATDLSVLQVELFLMVMLTLTRLPMMSRGLNFKVQLQGLTLIPLQTLESPIRRDLLRVVMVLLLIFMRLI